MSTWRTFRSKDGAATLVGLLVAVVFWSIPVATYAATSFNVTNMTAGNSATVGYNQFSEVRINDAGQVAFIGRNPLANRSDVFFHNGTTLANITKGASEFSIFTGAAFLRLNQKGQLAFVGTGSPGTAAPIFYDGTSLVNLNRLAPTGGVVNSDAIALNDLGQVAFAGCFQVCGQILFFNGTNVNVICSDPCGFGSFVWELSINNRGHVAWGGGSQNGIGFYDGTSVRDLTDDPVAKGSGFSFFGIVQLSDNDHLIFHGRQPAAIFYFDGESLRNLTLSDPIVGMAGFDSFLLPFALNTAGQAAFTAYKASVAGSSEVFYFDGTTATNITGADPVAGGSGFNFFGPPRLNSIGNLAFLGSVNADGSGGATFLLAAGMSLKKVTESGTGAAGSIPRINDAGHIVFTCKDHLTPALRSLDIFFFDGLSVQNLTGDDASVADRTDFILSESVPSSTQFNQFNNRDQVAALAFKADGTNDVFLFSPVGNDVVPIVLVHGICGAPQSFGRLGELLVSDGGLSDVTSFDYSAFSLGPRTHVRIEELTVFFAAHVNDVLERTGSSQVDVIAHSMGGLIARAWMASLANVHVPYLGQIRKLILAGTPNYGINRKLAGIRRWGCSDTQVSQITFGSEFLWDLHDAWDEFQLGPHRIAASDTLFIAGTQSAGTLECNNQGCDDGGVQIASAVLPGSTDQQIRYVPYRHADSKNIVALPRNGPALVAVTNEQHATYRIVKRFLQDGTVIPQCCGGGTVDYAPPHLRAGGEREREGLVWLRLKSSTTGERLTFSNAHVAPRLKDVAEQGNAGSIIYWGVAEGAYDVLVCGPRGFISNQRVPLSVLAARPFVPPAIRMSDAGLTCR